MKAILCSWDVINGYLQANVIINTPSGWVYQYIDTFVGEDDIDVMLTGLKEALQSLKNQDNISANDVYNAHELAWYNNSKYVYPCVLN